MKHLLIILLLTATSFGATTYYCDPVDGNSVTGDGSAGSPWGTLQSLFEADKVQKRTYNVGSEGDPNGRDVDNPTAPVAEGDTVKLMTGFHGEITDAIAGRAYLNYAYITLEAADSNTPTLSKIDVQSWSYWKFIGIKICREDGVEVDENGMTILTSTQNGRTNHILINQCTIQPATDDHVSDWTKTNWVDRIGTGIQIAGDDITVSYNTLRNVGFGITMTGSDIDVANNTINRFCYDGLRSGGQGDRQEWTYNDVRNSLDINDNHDDGFQCYAIADANMVDYVIANNTIIGYDDTTIPFVSSCQGVFIGSGFAHNWEIKNNLIVIYSYAEIKNKKWCEKTFS